MTVRSITVTVFDFILLKQYIVYEPLNFSCLHQGPDTYSPDTLASCSGIADIL